MSEQKLPWRMPKEVPVKYKEILITRCGFPFFIDCGFFEKIGRGRFCVGYRFGKIKWVEVSAWMYTEELPRPEWF